MKKITIILIIVTSIFKLNAQQLPQYSNYMINDYVINPGISGTNPYFEGKSNNRYQWIGVTDAPRTYILSVNGPIKSLNMGVGGILFTDIVGHTRRTGLYGSYAYHLKINEKVKVSLGLSGGLLQFVIDRSKINLENPNDPVYNDNDGLMSVTIPDFGAGIYAYSVDHTWFISASVPQMLQNKLKFFDYSTSTLSKLASHAYLMGGYKYEIKNNFKIEPSICLKYVNPTPLQFDIGLRAIYQDKIWLGTAYRSRDAIALMLGYVMQNNITFSYSYDFTTSNIRKYSSGTHELMIGVRFYKYQNKAEVPKAE